MLHNSSFPSTPLKCLRYLALVVLLLQILTFVIKLLAFSQTKLCFHHTALEVKTQWNQRVALLPDLAEKLYYLLLVKQQFSGSVGFVVFPVTEFIRRYMQVVDKRFA